MAFVRLHRDHEGGCGVVGAPEHQQLAYEAASQSLILLKNDAGTLPLSATSPVRHTPNHANPSVLVSSAVLREPVDHVVLLT